MKLDAEKKFSGLRSSMRTQTAIQEVQQANIELFSNKI